MTDAARTGGAPARRVTVHEPGRGSTLDLPGYLARTWAHRTFIVALGRTGERAAHRATRLGAVWTVANPLLLAGVYVLLVTVLRGGSGGGHYLGQVVGGLFLFTYTRTSALGGARSITRNTGLVTSTALPRATLPLAAVVAAARSLVPMLAVYAAIHLAVGLPLGWSLLAMIPLLAVMSLLNAGLALGLAAAAVQVRDVNQALPYVLRIAVYLSPILYRTEELTDRLPDGWAGLVHLNPLAGLLGATQSVLLDGTWPRATDVAAAVAWAVVVAGGGLAYFRARERGFAAVV